jgi:hypothetical protein
MSKVFLRCFLPAGIICTGLVMMSPSSFGKAEYTKKEKKACTLCHTSSTSKELTAVGKCYAEHNHSLEGCEVKK